MLKQGFWYMKLSYTIFLIKMRNIVLDVITISGNTTGWRITLKGTIDI